MKKLLLLTIALAMIVIVLPAQATPGTVYVDDDNCPGPGSGTLADPYCKIQDAINAATGGDIISVAAGTYNERLTVHKSVDLRGAQYGVDPTAAGARANPANESTITEAGLPTPNPDVLVEIPSGVTGVVVDGFTLVGDPTNTTADTSVIRCWDDDITISNNIIDGLYGVLYKGGDALTVHRNRMVVNKLGVTVQPNPASNVTISDNVIDLGSSPVGGESATYMTSCSYCSVTGNTGTGFVNGRGTGGSNVSHLTVSGNTFTGNSDGISFWGNTTYVAISDNDLSNSLRYGINIKGQDIDISGNEINGCGDSGINIARHEIDTERVEIRQNNITGNTNNGLQVDFLNVTEMVDATCNWWGAVDGPSGTGPGSGDAVSDGAYFDPWLTIPAPAECPSVGPLASNVQASPNPVAAGQPVQITANVDDSTTGGSNIASAEYTLDGGTTWHPMDADPSTPEIDGFDSSTEDVTATPNAPATAGIYDLCVRGTDEPDNTGGPECIMLVVYDPDGGFVTGGGWIDSQPHAYTPPFFLETFDSDPPLSDSATDGAWYPDRYPPAVFEAAFFDGGNRLHVHISADDYLPHGSTFYNFQGRKFNLWYGLDTYIMADLYIGQDWEANDRHASLWATTYDADNNISGYPIMGFTSGTGFRIWTQDLDQNTSNGYQYGWYDIGIPGGFQYGAWYAFRAVLTSSAYHYYIDGGLVWTDIVTFDSVLWANMMLQAYNYGEDYDVYWDNVGAGPLGPTGRANFGFISKYKKGAAMLTGNTEFVFKAADLNFHSTSYDWLIVTGSDYARFKGSGTINGGLAPNGQEYRFLLWAGDGEPDTFRIRIWWEEAQTEHVVYDNGFDQAIAGGQIVIHTKNK